MRAEAILIFLLLSVFELLSWNFIFSLNNLVLFVLFHLCCAVFLFLFLCSGMHAKKSSSQLNPFCFSLYISKVNNSLKDFFSVICWFSCVVYFVHNAKRPCSNWRLRLTALAEDFSNGLFKPQPLIQTQLREPKRGSILK